MMVMMRAMMWLSLMWLLMCSVVEAVSNELEIKLELPFSTIENDIPGFARNFEADMFKVLGSQVTVVEIRPELSSIGGMYVVFTTTIDAVEAANIMNVQLQIPQSTLRTLNAINTINNTYGVILGRTTAGGDNKYDVAKSGESSPSIVTRSKDYVIDHWLYASIGGGVLFFAIIICCCGRKNKKQKKQNQQNSKDVALEEHKYLISSPTNLKEKDADKDKSNIPNDSHIAEAVSRIISRDGVDNRRISIVIDGKLNSYDPEQQKFVPAEEHDSAALPMREKDSARAAPIKNAATYGGAPDKGNANVSAFAQIKNFLTQGYATGSDDKFNTNGAASRHAVEEDSAGHMSLKINIDIPSDDLKFGNVIGEGGFGTVYKGKYMNSEVAIKQLTATLTVQTINALKSEAAIMCQLRSPFIVHFYGLNYSQKHNNYNLVMEYLPRGSLYSVLHSTAEISWPIRYRISKDIAFGLNYLHRQNPIILHRDVKSLNVLLTNDMHARLTDFGLAQAKSEAIASTLAATKDNTVVNAGAGSTLWMAPELLLPKPVFSTASDVYGLGMVLFEIAARKLPFADAASAALVPAWVLQGERDEIPNDVPPGYAKLITMSWCQDSNHRLSAQQVGDACDLLTTAFPVEEAEVGALLRNLEAASKQHSRRGSRSGSLAGSSQRTYGQTVSKNRVISTIEDEHEDDNDVNVAPPAFLETMAPGGNQASGGMSSVDMYDDDVEAPPGYLLTKYPLEDLAKKPDH